MKRESLWLSVIYCVAHFPLLLASGYFYDDWVLYNPDPQMNIGLWWNAGRPLTGYFLSAVHALDGAFLPRFISFITYLLSALFLLYVLRTIDLVDPASRFWVVIIFAVFPADNTRILDMLACDSVYFCCFFLGWCLVAVYLRKGTLLLRFASLIAFLLSFWLNSLLVFFSLVLTYMFYMSSSAQISFRSAQRFIARYPDFLLAPVVFWLMQRLMFYPQAEEVGYNQFHVASLGPRPWVSALKGAVVDPMLYSVIPFDWFWCCAVLVGGTFLFLMLSKTLAESGQNHQRDLVLFICGVWVLFAALFPYLAVGKIPVHWDWLSRHARLVPLGVGLILCYGGRLASQWGRVNSQVLLYVYCVLVCVMVSGNVRTYSAYWLDWYKAISLVKEFRLSDEIKKNTSFLFHDECRDLNAERRTYRFYEYCALMNLAFGEDSRFGTEETLWNTRTSLDDMRILLTQLRSWPNTVDYAKAYFMSRWVPQSPKCRVRILCRAPKPGFVDLLRLKYLELFDSSRFYSELPDLVYLDVAPSCGIPHK
jgi:hypothetical protein